MRRLQGWLYTALLLAVVIKVLWWAIEPAVPLLIIAFALVWILGVTYRRTLR